MSRVKGGTVTHARHKKLLIKRKAITATMLSAPDEKIVKGMMPYAR